ncbi:chondroadherin-like protein [Penaeus chinensis]|uniref:chondroadherin-like protein n=1 Tax=Penaeus chinensis TaxID=139456 RepID=UPI001FB60352|nr:chondroadherin-like protein [Penaeus chinensis]
MILNLGLLLLALLLWCAAREGALLPGLLPLQPGRARAAGGGLRGPGGWRPTSRDGVGGRDTGCVVSSPPRRPSSSRGPILLGLPPGGRPFPSGRASGAGELACGGLQRLRVLNLTRNHIAALMDTNFRGADDLRALDLSRNRIASVPSAVFRHVRRLRGPRWLYYVCPSWPEQFSDVPELRQLACAGCGLLLCSSFPAGAGQVQGWPRPNLFGTQVPPGIATTFLPELMTLLLDANLVSFVERGVIGGSALQTLQLAHNRISRVEVGAFANSSLKTLDLSYNRLTHLDTRAISEVLLHLHELHLSGNSLHIEQLLVVLPEADQLRRLSLGDMGLTRLPAELLQHLRYLHHLNFLQLPDQIPHRHPAQRPRSCRHSTSPATAFRRSTTTQSQ